MMPANSQLRRTAPSRRNLVATFSCSSRLQATQPDGFSSGLTPTLTSLRTICIAGLPEDLEADPRIGAGRRIRALLLSYRHRDFRRPSRSMAMNLQFSTGHRHALKFEATHAAVQ